MLVQRRHLRILTDQATNLILACPRHVWEDSSPCAVSAQTDWFYFKPGAGSSDGDVDRSLSTHTLSVTAEQMPGTQQRRNFCNRQLTGCYCGILNTIHVE